MADGCINTHMARLLGAPPLLDSIIQFNPDLSHGDLAMIFLTGGLAQGLSYLLGLCLQAGSGSVKYFPGGLILVPLLGTRGSLMLGSSLFTLAPIFTYFSLNVSVPLISCTYGLLNGFAVNLTMLGGQSLSSYEYHLLIFS